MKMAVASYSNEIMSITLPYGDLMLKSKAYHKLKSLSTHLELIEKSF